MISNQKNLEGHRPVKNTCITQERWAFGTPQILVAKRVMMRERDSSSFFLSPRSMVVDGLGYMLARK